MQKPAPDVPTPDISTSINSLNKTVNKLNSLNKNISKMSNKLNLPSNVNNVNANMPSNVNANVPSNVNDAVSDVVANNLAEPVETFSALSFCSQLLWGIPIIVSVIQIFLWCVSLYRKHVLQLPTEAEISQNKQKQLESKIDELKVLIKKQTT